MPQISTPIHGQPMAPLSLKYGQQEAYTVRNPDSRVGYVSFVCNVAWFYRTSISGSKTAVAAGVPVPFAAAAGDTVYYFGTQTADGLIEGYATDNLQDAGKVINTGSVSGDFSIGGDSNITGDSEIGGDSHVVGDTDLDGNLNVDGNTVVGDVTASHVTSGNLTTGEVVAYGSNAAGTPVNLLGSSVNEGYEVLVMDEVIVCAASVENPMSNAVPKGAMILSVQANAQTALTAGGTTATWSVGTTATPNLYGTAGSPTQADSLAKNSKSNKMIAPSALSADTTIKVIGAETGGAAAGDTGLTGSVRVQVVYAIFTGLVDAA